MIRTLVGVALGAALALPATSTLAFVARDAAGHRTAASLAARWLAYHAARAVFTLLRAVPELVWVLVCILAVGLGPFAGTLATTTSKLGFYTRLTTLVASGLPARAFDRPRERWPALRLEKNPASLLPADGRVKCFDSNSA